MSAVTVQPSMVSFLGVKLVNFRTPPLSLPDCPCTKSKQKPGALVPNEYSEANFPIDYSDTKPQTCDSYNRIAAIYVPQQNTPRQVQLLTSSLPSEQEECSCNTKTLDTKE